MHNYFTFSKLKSPLDGTHPVTGNRCFWIYNTIGNSSEFTFYTLGVDRTWSFLDVVLNNATVPPLIFSCADALWTNMQNKMILFIQQYGGAAQLYNQKIIIARPNWEQVRRYLVKEISIQELKIALGC